MRSLWRLLHAAAWATLLHGAPASAQNVPVRIIGINDFHGHLEPAGNAIAVPDPANPGRTVPLRSGGAAFLATRINQLKAEQPRHVIVSAGDLVGASPLTSALFHDEPTIEVMNAIGLDINALGNHEFDRGVSHLLRLANGGCESRPKANHQTCAAADGKFSGARFSFLAANVLGRENEQPIVTPTQVKSFDGVRVGFIGAVTRSTPGIVVPSGVAGVRFVGEAKAINRYAKELQAQGVQTIVAVVHEGGDADGGFGACLNPRGAIFDLARELDAAIDIVLSAHTHRGYNCLIDGRVIIQAASYGRLISVVDIEIDRATEEVVRERTRARNVTVPNGERTGHALRTAYPPLAPEPKVAAIVEHYRKLAAPLAERPIGYIVADFDRRASPGGDSALGRLVADAQLAASRTHGAQIAFTNPGGLRANLSASGPNGLVTYADAFLSQPFGNTLVTLTLTGAQLRQLLEQQWSNRRSETGSERARMLQPSRGFAYAWRSNAPHGERVVTGSMRLDGRPIELDDTYRVTVNNFLAEGGDGFRVLREGTHRAEGPADVDALTAYLSRASSTQPMAPDRTARISRR
ncbi:MAG TPA: bifunctional metallophosphatase/5'-nucleotidase [Burkholderiaceae bacterium]|nr:bifunctional metallophosphatase/5'-nucleotidase [Burkholderiaceae bacterium]